MKTPELFVIVTDKGFLSYDDHTFELIYTTTFSLAEPYYSFLQAVTTAKDTGLKNYWILQERKATSEN